MQPRRQRARLVPDAPEAVRVALKSAAVRLRLGGDGRLQSTDPVASTTQIAVVLTPTSKRQNIPSLSSDFPWGACATPLNQPHFGGQPPGRRDAPSLQSAILWAPYFSERAQARLRRHPAVHPSPPNLLRASTLSFLSCTELSLRIATERQCFSAFPLFRFSAPSPMQILGTSDPRRA